LETDKKPNPKVMILLLMVAIIGGSLFSIIWPVAYSIIQARTVLGDMQPPAKASKEERGEYYRAAMKKAQDNKLEGDLIPRTARNYADWLEFDCRNHSEAKKAYLKCLELGDKRDGNVRTVQADALISAAYCDHNLYFANKGKPPDPQIALDAQKQQIQAAKDLGFTGDVNDVERQRRTLEAIATFYCDNGKPAEALKYIDDAIAVAKKNHATQATLALCQIIKARALAGMSKNDEADKLFRDCVNIADTTYGAGSNASELVIRHYADDLVRDGQVEHGNKVKEMQDDFSTWESG